MSKRGPKVKTAANSPMFGAGSAVISWDDVEPPDGLSDVAREAWDHVVGLLRKAGTLEKTDPRLVELYAVNADLVRRGYQEVDRDGMTFATKGGAFKPHPSLAVINQASIRLKGIIGEMGLSPASASLSSPVDDFDESDPIAHLLREQGVI